MSVYNIEGRLMGVLAERAYEAGRHVVVFDASGLPSGPYLIRLEASDVVLSRKVSLVK